MLRNFLRSHEEGRVLEVGGACTLPKLEADRPWKSKEGADA